MTKGKKMKSEDLIWSEALDNLNTPRDFIRFGTTRFMRAGLFFGHGFPDALTESRYLVAFSLQLAVSQADQWLDAKLTKFECEQVLDLLKLRCESRQPAAYLTGEAWLAGFRFRVDPRTIVPRSLIGELLEDEALTPWLDISATQRIADICTGGASLAILLALLAPDAEVDAVDLSSEALEVAELNVADYHMQSRVHLLHGDLMSPLNGKYDLIVSNPPYVDAKAMAHLPEEYRNEPRMSLESGKDGLDHSRALIAGAKELLNEDGILMVEVGHQRATLELSYPDLPFTWLESRDGGTYVFVLRQQDL
jgi:ribosomal protein L3 glutamine methyltransferase